MPIHQYQIVGRKEPTASDPNPQLFRMQIFAKNKVNAKSRFWYFLHQYKKMKKTTGEILSVNEIFEKNNRIAKNYGIWLRYNSRSGTHNMYKEYRALTLTDAVDQMYSEMASRHRARYASIQIIRNAIIPAAELRRNINMQFAKSGVRFPLAHRIPRDSHRKFKKVFTRNRPTTFMG